MTDILTLLSGPMDREQKLEQALKMARSWMHCVEPRLLDTPNFRRDMDALDDALSGPKAEAVTVKPLEWGETSYGNPEVTTIVGVYRINESMAGGWSVVAGKLILKTSDGRVNFPTKDAAKAAAQADYEARILSAIATSPVPALTDEAVRVAAQGIFDRMSSTYRARNGREVSIEADDGEKCWIVHSDDIEQLSAALIAAFPSKGGTNG